MLDYHYGHQRLAGLNWRSFDIRKHRATTHPTETASSDNREQQLLYSSADFYWLHPLTTTMHGTVGLREDHFRNYFRQLDLDYDSLGFNLWA